MADQPKLLAFTDWDSIEYPNDFMEFEKALHATTEPTSWEQQLIDLSILCDPPSAEPLDDEMSEIAKLWGLSLIDSTDGGDSADNNSAQKDTTKAEPVTGSSLEFNAAVVEDSGESQGKRFRNCFIQHFADTRCTHL